MKNLAEMQRNLMFRVYAKKEFSARYFMQTFVINLLFGKVEGFPQDKPIGRFTNRMSVNDVMIAHL
ncbi:hypothetical protein JCM37172_22670 [Faecalimonas hominis]|jgi:hypothetical protein